LHRGPLPLTAQDLASATPNLGLCLSHGGLPKL
jgi:hypothetical protein